MTEPTTIIGDVAPHFEKTIPLDVWRYELDAATGKKTGRLQRERMRSLKEVYADLVKELDVKICNRCGLEKPVNKHYGEMHKGCGGEFEPLIDEYFHGPTDYPGEPRDVPANYRWIARFPVTGGSEGHYVHVELVAPGKTDREPLRLVRLALGKTFRGFDHAAKIAVRCAKLLGA